MNDWRWKLMASEGESSALTAKNQRLIMSPFCKLDNSWPFIEDNSIFLPIEDYIDSGFDQNILQLEKSSVAEARFDERLLQNKLLEHKQDNSSSVPLEVSDSTNIPSSIHQEESILPIKEITTTTNCFEFNSFLEKDASTELITDNSLSIILKASKSSCPVLEERSMSPSITRINDTIDLFDPSIFLVHESLALEPCIHGELQECSLHNCNEGNLSNCFEACVSSREILEEGSMLLTIDQNRDISGGFDSRMLPEREPAMGGPSIDEGIVGERLEVRTRERRHTFKRLQTEEKIVQLSEEDGSISKKQEHNAREKVRRMKLNASYLALGALLPSDFRRKKKRRNAPSIIDRALDYIPELENEIEKQTLKKNNLLSTIDNEKNLCKNSQSSELDQAPTVSVHEVAKGELIIQGCTLKDQNTAFSKLLQNVEAEGMRIMSASSLQVSKERLCYHLHIQVNESSLEADNVTVLREEIISWLR